MRRPSFPSTRSLRFALLMLPVVLSACYVVPIAPAHPPGYGPGYRHYGPGYRHYRPYPGPYYRNGPYYRGGYQVGQADAQSLLTTHPEGAAGPSFEQAVLASR
jgi:hypothetical protein